MTTFNLLLETCRSFVCTMRTTMPPFVSNYQRYIAVYGGEDSEKKATGLMMGSIYEVGASWGFPHGFCHAMAKA
ncbi:hypothetical protein FOZ62_006211 [Perkinsus olseni]|uniref:Uncharacterized protein n=1 Tax=Perkinsus olseni TaxID=32597 RepID=A0A7J6Q2E3_PEROL|nr:hypothetical protein FOZ62_006211 [Perkinsus olseni]